MLGLSFALAVGALVVSSASGHARAAEAQAPRLAASEGDAAVRSHPKLAWRAIRVGREVTFGHQLRCSGACRLTLAGSATLDLEAGAVIRPEGPQFTRFPGDDAARRVDVLSVDTGVTHLIRAHDDGSATVMVLPSGVRVALRSGELTAHGLERRAVVDLLLDARRRDALRRAAVRARAPRERARARPLRAQRHRSQARGDFKIVRLGAFERAPRRRRRVRSTSSRAPVVDSASTSRARRERSRACPARAGRSRPRASRNAALVDAVRFMSPKTPAVTSAPARRDERAREGEPVELFAVHSPYDALCVLVALVLGLFRAASARCSC